MNTPEMPTVSVVIPTHNAAEFLAEAVDSVLGQTYQPLEVIVVDDGSEDETSRVAAAFTDRIIYLHKEWAGLSSARNTGIRAASGEWIALLDADDIWMPDRLQRQLKLAAETGADLVFCDAKTLGSKDNIGPTRFEQYGLKAQLERLAPDGVLLNPFELLLEAGCYVLPSTVLVKKECLLQVGLFDEALYTNEDMDLWLRQALTFRFAVLNDALVARRIHEKNMSRNTWAIVAGEIKICEKLQTCPPTGAHGRRWRGLLRKKTASLFRQQGSLYLERRDRRSARRSWARSLRSSFSATVAAFWLISLLPQSWVDGLRNWKLHTQPLNFDPAAKRR